MFRKKLGLVLLGIGLGIIGTAFVYTYQTRHFLDYLILCFFASLFIIAGAILTYRETGGKIYGKYTDLKVWFMQKHPGIEAITMIVLVIATIFYATSTYNMANTMEENFLATNRPFVYFAGKYEDAIPLRLVNTGNQIANIEGVQCLAKGEPNAIYVPLILKESLFPQDIIEIEIIPESSPKPTEWPYYVTCTTEYNSAATNEKYETIQILEFNLDESTNKWWWNVIHTETK